MQNQDHIPTTPRGQHKTIGSSDVSAILGLNPMSSPYQVWARLVGLTESEDLSDNEFIYWGNKLEAAIAEGVSDRENLVIKKNDMKFVDAEYDFLSATPDYFYLDSGEHHILECKNTSQFMASVWEDNGIPDHAHVQVLHQMRVIQDTHSKVAGLIGGNKLAIRDIDMDLNLSGAITDQLVSFWKLVTDQIAPPFQDGDASFLAKVYPRDNGSVINLPAEAEIFLKAIDEANQQIKHWESIKEKGQAEIKAMLKDHSIGMVNGRKVTWKLQSRVSVDTTRLKLELPAVAAQYSKESESRYLRIGK